MINFLKTRFHGAKINFAKKASFLILFSFFCSGIISCKNSKLPKTELVITTSEGKNVSVVAEIAATPEERSFGFMEREKIPDGTGMIFVFEKDQILSFWMKNTPHPLSIAYIDSKGKIRDIFDMTPFSLSSIVSTVSVRYALEVPQGWFEKNGIQEGDYINLENLK